MIISRRFASDVWTLENLLTFFSDELKAKENCANLPKNSSSEIRGVENRFSAAGLQLKVKDQKTEDVFIV